MNKACIMDMVHVLIHMDDKKKRSKQVSHVQWCVAIVKCDASTYDSKEDKLKEEIGVVVL